MVQLLASVLDIPLGERNTLLLGAGYAPAYGERQLDASELAHVRRALSFVLRQQEPFPAIVVDAGWNIIMRNEAAGRIFGLFLDGVDLGPGASGNAMHHVCHPQGLRRFIVNWEEFAGPLIQTIHREAAGGTNTPAVRLLDELLAYPGMPARWKVPDPRAPASAVLAMRLQKDGLALAFFSMVTALAIPRDVMLEHLRIECFYPADDATEATARRLAANALTLPAAH